MRCDECKFWEDLGGCGNCHRYPPVLIRASNPMEVDSSALEISNSDEPLRPFIDPDDWCGEFQNSDVEED